MLSGLCRNELVIDKQTERLLVLDTVRCSQLGKESRGSHNRSRVQDFLTLVVSCVQSATTSGLLYSVRGESGGFQMLLTLWNSLHVLLGHTPLGV